MFADPRTRFGINNSKLFESSAGRSNLINCGLPRAPRRRLLLLMDATELQPDCGERSKKLQHSFLPLMCRMSAIAFDTATTPCYDQTLPQLIHLSLSPSSSLA